MANKESRIGQLLKAAQASRQSLEPYRKQHYAITKLLAGPRYGDNRTEKTRYVDLLGMYRGIQGRALLAKAPRVMLSSFDRSLEATVKAEQEWINKEIVDINLGNTLARCVDNGLISIGICMVALATPEDASKFAWHIKAGQPFARPIALDNFLVDMNANDFDEVYFIGHRYRAAYESVMDNKRYSKKAKEMLSVSHNDRYNAEGDPKIHNIGKPEYTDYDEFEDMVDLWQIYCPHHGCVYTFADHAMTGPVGGTSYNMDVEPLYEQTWVGVEQGPYHILAYDRIPDNLMPKGPMSRVADLDEAANGIYRKMMRQADRLKENTYFRDQDTANRAVKLSDGEAGWAMNAKEEIIKVIQGGIDPGLNLAFREVFERFSMMSDNLITLGGISPQAGTLGQENLLAQQAGGAITSKQQTTALFAKSVIRAFCFYWWNDPENVQKIKHDVKDSPGIGITREIHPWTSNDHSQMRRDGDMPLVDIDIYSMRPSSPQQRAMDIIAFATKLYMPMAQLFQQRGITLDVQELAKILGEYQDLPELQRLLNMQQPMPPPEGASGQDGGQGGQAPPDEGPSTVFRRDVGGNSTQGNNAEMESSLEKMMSGGQQNGQMNGTVR